jgi:acyl-CoA hydrolase
VGELVELRALVIRSGRTSLDVAVDVYAGDPKSAERRRTGHCVVVFVALDPGGRPVEVPSWRPESEVDRALEDYAVRLGELRREMDAEMDRRLSTLSQSFQVETTGGGAA